MGIAFSPRRRCNCSKVNGAPLRNGSLCRGAGCVRGTLCAAAKLAGTAASKTAVRKNRQIRFIHTLLHFLFGVLRAANSFLPHSSLGAIGVRRQNLVYRPAGLGKSPPPATPIWFVRARLLPRLLEGGPRPWQV